MDQRAKMDFDSWDPYRHRAGAVVMRETPIEWTQGGDAWCERRGDTYLEYVLTPVIPSPSLAYGVEFGP